VLPFFGGMRIISSGPAMRMRSGGEWRIEAPRVRWDILDAFRAAASEAGIKPIPDFQHRRQRGLVRLPRHQKRGRRWSAARGFLKPVLGGRTCGSRPNAGGGDRVRRQARHRRALAAAWRVKSGAVAAR